MVRMIKKLTISWKVMKIFELQYFLPKSYKTNENNTHFDDTGFTGQYQKEVYMLARDILRKMTRLGKNRAEKLTAIDVGCGSGWKLVNYLSEEFRTVGIETEPALSFLRKTYPNQVTEPREVLLKGKARYS
jgi:hypothetical protein